MIPLKFVCLFTSLLTITSAHNEPRSSRWHSNENSIRDNLKPTDWISVSELESLPSMREMTVNNLERMTLQEGAEMLQKMYHLSQAGRAFKGNSAPKASEINAYYITADNKKVSLRLNELPKIAREERNMGNQEITIYMTGLPETTETISKATRKLVQAYMQRYNGQTSSNKAHNSNSEERDEKSPASSSEEESKENSNTHMPSGNIIVIEMGNTIGELHQQATLDVEKTGMEVGDILVQLTDNTNIPHEIIHLIGSNMGAHIAGAAGRHFTRETGHKLHRITGLDPSRILGRTKGLRGLTRGDAEFVDVIHTSALGMGTTTRSGDVDLYPNGPGEGVPGADNVIEASMRAVRYFAESVVPGNEHNFPAVAANSIEQYKDHNGNGKRMHMGINIEHDAKGDFMLEVNSKSPFGRRTPAQQQRNYHKAHKPSKMHSHAHQ